MKKGVDVPSDAAAVRDANPLVPHDVADAIVQVGRRLDARGWVPATAGNISQRLDQSNIAITRSGVHKGFLSREDIILVTTLGRSVDGIGRPSAETLLHCQIYEAFPDTGAVVHGHSVAGTVLSRQTRANALRFEGYEVQKVFEGQSTHAAALDLPLVENDQDIPRLVQTVAAVLLQTRMGYLIRGHGTYVWGPTMPVAMARFEALEFLLACELEQKGRAS